MYLTNFIYDNISLNSFGYIVCEFNTSSQDTISNGSNIEFTTVPMNNGRHFALANSKYSEVITATFSICKDPCVANYSPALTVTEISEITSWLTRLGFHKLQVDADGYENLFFMGSFHNVSRVELGGEVIGLTFEFTSDAPFAYKNQRIDTLTFTQAGTQELYVYTDDLGEFYPTVKITCGAAGDITINDCTIKNCRAGEIINIDYPTISEEPSRNAPHDLANDFNYNFIPLYKGVVGAYEINEITASAPCTIEFKYNPIVKVGL